jgi:multisubunit Na+/H+ antiporter MnhG subunit
LLVIAFFLASSFFSIVATVALLRTFFEEVQ